MQYRDRLLDPVEHGEIGDGVVLKDGKVRRGMLGVNIQNLTDDTAKALELKDTEAFWSATYSPEVAAERPA